MLVLIFELFISVLENPRIDLLVVPGFALAKEPGYGVQ